MALKIKITSTPYKYLKLLDATTRERIKTKLGEIASNPEDSRFSYPLVNSVKRASRVGKYRILFTTDADTLTVSDIDSRGQVYRNA